MRVDVRWLILGLLVAAAGAAPAAAQSLDGGSAAGHGVSAILSAFPGGQSLAITTICVVAGTILLRLTRWLGMVLTAVTCGFLAVVLVLAVEPQALTRLVQAL
ncbi:MAG: hypothetical protein R3D57_10640 [Hyphomicrobiaceae bacterium]